jgi:hypothetical protein
MSSAARAKAAYDPTRDLVSSERARGSIDLCTRTGAEQQAAALTAWWHARGFTTVRHWIEPMPKHPRTHVDGASRTRADAEKIWQVRSNLIGGLPPRAAPTPSPPPAPEVAAARDASGVGLADDHQVLRVQRPPQEPSGRASSHRAPPVAASSASVTAAS